LDGGTAGQTTLTGHLIGDGSNNSTIQGYIIKAYGLDCGYHLMNTGDGTGQHGFWVNTYNANMIGYNLSSATANDWNNVLYIGNRFGSGHTVIGTAHQQGVTSAADLATIIDDGLGNMTVVCSSQTTATYTLGDCTITGLTLTPTASISTPRPIWTALVPECLTLLVH
jgi:hypothetical protein